MIQTATTLPLFILAVPTGALADIFDRRRYLIKTQLWMMLVTGVLGIFTLYDHINVWSLLFSLLRLELAQQRPYLRGPLLHLKLSLKMNCNEQYFSMRWALIYRE